VKKINANFLKPSQQQLNNLLKCYQTGRYIEAEKLSISITQEFPKNQFGWKILGAVLLKLGKKNESLDICKKSLQLAPNDSEAHNNLGVILQQLDRLSEAEASFRQAITLKPNYTEAHINLGNALREQDKLKEAEASFRQAVTLQPDLAVAQYNLGKIYKKIGKNSKAVECFEKTLELSPEDLLGATLQLATLGKRKIPDKTPENFMQGFYKKKYKYWSNLEKKKHKYRGHLLIENAFKKTHNNIEKIDILDMGCGTGSLAKILRPYARSLVGVDLSPSMLLKAEEICLYDSLYKKDLSQYLSEVSNHYDTIIAAAVLIHFYDLDNIFFLIKDSLKINGKFVFSIFEETQKNRNLNSFLMYAHSDDYITTLAERLNLKIIYKKKDIHEYHKGNSVPAIIYVLEKK
jgi:predicted TPR repeat methyltransferase